MFDCRWRKVLELFCTQNIKKNVCYYQIQLLVIVWYFLLGEFYLLSKNPLQKQIGQFLKDTTKVNIHTIVHDYIAILYNLQKSMNKVI